MVNADSGIYLITNLINRKKYVGQSLAIRQRWLSHLRKKSCLALFSALEKYGKENFKFEIVYCTNDREEMNRVETLFIKEYGFMYPSALGHKLSDEAKEQIRQKKLGQKHTEETKKKMSESQLRRYAHE
jgi:group I intron endonuclease